MPPRGSLSLEGEGGKENIGKAFWYPAGGRSSRPPLVFEYFFKMLKYEKWGANSMVEVRSV